MNHTHKFQLVEAERARIQGKVKQALELYDHAIRGALENSFIQDAALACELAGSFLLDTGDIPKAEEYIQAAHANYREWGAKAKVKDLEQKYPNFLAPR